MDNELQSIANELDEIGWTEMITATSDIIKPSAEQLQIMAVRYINLIDSYATQVKAFENLLKRQKMLRKNFKNYSIIDEYIKQKELVSNFLKSQIPQKIYSASFSFQKQLNLFLNQEIKMIFVYEGVAGPELFQITGPDILPGYSSQNKLSARYKFNPSIMKKINLDELDQNFISGVKNTYAEVLHRWNITRAHHNHVILWQIPQGHWFLMKVSSKGDINEAYATIVIQNQQPPTFQENEEINVRDFMSFVSKVDNTSGLLQGDTSRTDSNIEFGIKSEGASVLGLKQIYVLAKKIAHSELGQIQNILEQKKKDFQSKGHTRNKAYDLANYKYEEILKILDNSGEKTLLSKNLNLFEF